MELHKHPYPHTQNGYPSLVELELTSKCNAHCVFCPRYLFNKTKMIEKSIFEQVIFRLREAHIKCVKLVGMGEPTLHPDFMWIIRQLRNKGFQILLNTNGSLIHQCGFEKILALCDEVIISFHSLNPEIHKSILGIDCYDQVLSNIENLLKINEHYNRVITLYVVLTILNINADEQIRKFWGSRVNIRSSGCTNRTIEGFAKNILDIKINCQYNHYPTISERSPMCGYAEAALVIDSQGQYLLCTNDVKRNTGLPTVWESSVLEVFSEIRIGFENGRFLESCRSCDNFEKVSN